jgi:hypothetical protein
MEYIIAIPSYKRAELCNNKTLKMLKDNNILPIRGHPADPDPDPDHKRNCIIVFVANEDEYTEYETKLNKSLYNEIIIGVKGLVQQRQFIMNHYPINKNIVFFDDDIESVDLSLGTTSGELDLFLKFAFEKTKELGGYIWGVYPVFNPFFRKQREEISTCLNYIVGGFYGIINRTENNNLSLTLTLENSQKEDVERSIRYFIKDGIVVRFNKIGFITKYYGKSGGLGTFKDRLVPMANASQLLKNTFPEYGNVFIRKNGMTEFKLKKLK